MTEAASIAFHPDGTPAGIVVAEASALSGLPQTLFRKHAGTLITVDGHPPSFFIHVPGGIHHEAAISYHCSAGAHGVIVLGKDAHATIVETLQFSAADASAHAVEIVLEDGARLEFVSVQASDPAARVTITQRSRVGDNAAIMWKNVTIGGKQTDHDLRSELAGAHAESSIDWMFYASGNEQQRLTARNVFAGRAGGGEIVMNGVAEDKGHVRCDGMIEIGPGGGQTDTYLTQDVLMLDKTSKVDAIPGLEIKTNDVKASHSATVSRVTDEDLFYFASRAIPEGEARRMFVEGFLGELLGRIRDVKAREEALSLIEAKYSKNGTLAAL